MKSRFRMPVAVSVALCAAAAVGALSPGPAAADKPDSRDLREDLRFAADMAEKGLWREALFRWNRALRARPDDAALHNNVGVALEALGRRGEAFEAYERALELGAEDEIRTNFELARRAMELGRREPPEPPSAEPASPSPPDRDERP
jgi:Flp pilus assembly protein TadD